MKSWRRALSLIGLVVLTVLLAGSCVPWNPLAGAGFGGLKIYWISDNRLYRADLDGGSMEELYADSGAPNYSAIALDPVNKKAYWAGSAPSGTIYRADLDGAGKQTVASVGAISPTALAVDPYGEKLYYADSVTIYRMNLDGSGNESVHTTGGSINDLRLDPVNDRIYWCDGVTIYSSALTAPLSPQAVVSFSTTVSRIALDVTGGMIYFCDDTPPPQLYKAPLSGGGASSLASLTGSVGGLDVDPFEGRVYWSKPSASTGIYIDSVGVDGSGFKSVVSQGGSGDAVRLALFLWP